MFGYRIATMLFAAIFIRGCESKVVVDPVPPGTTANAEGVIYALPNTVARLQVKVDKTTKVSAPYMRYAAIFVPDGEPVCKDEKCRTEEDKNAYSLQQGTTFATYGEPDPANVFLVKFTGKRAVDQTLSMAWNETGLLSAASATVTNRTGDIILAGLKLAAGLAAKGFVGGESVDSPQTGPTPSPTLQYCKFDPSPTDTWVLPELRRTENAAARAYLVENYCAIKLEERNKFPKKDDPVTVIDPQTGVEKPRVFFDTATGAPRKDAAGNDIVYTYRDLLADAVKDYEKNIVPLVIARTNELTRSNSLDPAAQVALIQTELNQQFAALYLGTKKTLTWEGSLDVRGLDKVGSPIAVLRINPQAGICLGDSELAPDSKPIPVGKNKFTILPAAACAEAHPIYLTLSYFPDMDRQLFTKINDTTTGERSFRYRIPAQVKGSLTNVDNSKVYGSGVFSVAQLGKVISLPATRHSKTLSYELALIESTGGLKTFKLGSAGMLDTATIDALGGLGSTIGGTIIDAQKQNDEVNRLTRQNQLLKLQDEICTIQQKYGLPCTVQPQ